MSGGTVLEGTVLFCDICDYTQRCIVDGSGPTLEILQRVFGAFDNCLDECGVIKAGTIGDAYMVVCTKEDHAERSVRFAERLLEAASMNVVDIRIGMNSGRFTRACFGTPHATSYYGDTVNKASRMESNGFRNCIRVSTTTRQILLDRGEDADSFAFCGFHAVKSYGIIPMYILKRGAWEECVRDAVSARRRSSDWPVSLRRTT